MKKILLVDASPRKNGNCEGIVDFLTTNLPNTEITVFKMREKKCNPCLACAACQGKETQSCVQKDDIAALLPAIENCDAIVLASPIYFHQINSQAKLFIDRFYPFFNFAKKNMSNTAKFGKKAALVCVCWGGPLDVYEPYAAATAKNFAFIGAEEIQSIVFNQLKDRGDIKQREDYLAKLQGLAKWLAE